MKRLLRRSIVVLPWNTPPSTPFSFLSLGAGVQSSALALMAATGEIGPRLDAAIFADTQAEPASVYRWLDWLEGEIARSSHPFPVHRVTKGSLRAAALERRQTKDGKDYSRTSIPSYTVDPRNGSHGAVITRVCTKDFKIAPLQKAQKAIAGVARGQKECTVTTWIGISMDEMQRVKESRDTWCQLRYPLIESNMRRSDCLTWMQRRGYPQPPRSACTFCPYHSNAEWRRLKAEEPEAFADAVAFERELQGVKAWSANFDSVPYLHNSRVPLDQIDFSTAEERGQGTLYVIDSFADECEGMCGV